MGILTGTFWRQWFGQKGTSETYRLQDPVEITFWVKTSFPLVAFTSMFPNVLIRTIIPKNHNSMRQTLHSIIITIFLFLKDPPQ